MGDDIEISAKITFDQERFRAEFIDCFDLRYSLNWLGTVFANGQLGWSLESHTSTLIDLLQRLIGDWDQIKQKGGELCRMLQSFSSVIT